jgi:hypothetical protein
LQPDIDRMNSAHQPCKITCLALLLAVGALALRGWGGPLTFGGVTVDADAGELRFPARVNQREGPVEYLLVQDTGKVHESVLATAVRPADLHAAALLLGWAATNRTSATPLRILLRFPGTPAAIEAAGTIRLGGSNEPPALPWRYGGSVEFEGKFLAAQEGSIVTLIEDDTALIQSRHAERVRDDVWFANARALPALETPVEVIFRAASGSITNTP